MMVPQCAYNVSGLVCIPVITELALPNAMCAPMPCVHPMHVPVSPQGIPVRFIAAGSAACHSIIGTDDGKVYTFGRNDVCG